MTSGGYVASIEVVYAGSPISLIHFRTTGGQQGNVRAAVRRTSTLKPLPHAWRGLPSLNIWERVGTPRLPIEKKYGPSGPQMVGDSGVSESVANKMSSTVEAEIERQISRILAGV